MPLSSNTVTTASHISKAGSSPTKADDGESSPSLWATQAIQPLEGPVAQVARHLHPVLLLSLFLTRFGALVRDPVSTMWTSLLVVVPIQVGYVALCLPAVGSKPAKGGKARAGGEKKKKKKKGTEGSDVARIAITATVALVLSVAATAVTHVAFVLFGAPFLTHLPHTFLCALYLSVLALFPLFYARGLSSQAWLEVLGARAPLDEAFGGLVGGCLGGWLGAVPIPLDWDRDWQKWPITILCALFAGYLCGKVVGGTIGFGKRLG